MNKENVEVTEEYMSRKRKKEKKKEKKGTS